MANNILLHGATNCKSSNYGDFVYADMIYQYLQNAGMNAQFYQPSSFFCQYLKNYRTIFKIGKKDVTALVYIPGGYFGEGHAANWKENTIHFLRFMPIGIWAAFHQIPIAILGIGAGPLQWFPLKKSVQYICNHAKLITVRDEFSYLTLKKLCPANSNIIRSADLIVTNKNLKINKSNCRNNKVLLVHYNHSQEALGKFAEAVGMFFLKYPDYHIVVTSDQILSGDELLFEKFKRLSGVRCTFHRYNDPYEMSNLIGQADLIITSKLHVGVVGALMGKSVISVPCHPEKTMRFYKEINEADRCIPLFDATSNKIFELMQEKRLQQICISDVYIKKAEITWKHFENFLKELK